MKFVSRPALRPDTLQPLQPALWRPHFCFFNLFLLLSSFFFFFFLSFFFCKMAKANEERSKAQKALNDAKKLGSAGEEKRKAAEALLKRLREKMLNLVAQQQKTGDDHANHISSLEETVAMLQGQLKLALDKAQTYKDLSNERAEMAKQKELEELAKVNMRDQKNEEKRKEADNGMASVIRDLLGQLDAEGAIAKANYTAHKNTAESRVFSLSANQLDNLVISARKRARQALAYAASLASVARAQAKAATGARNAARHARTRGATALSKGDGGAAAAATIVSNQQLKLANASQVALTKIQAQIVEAQGAAAQAERSAKVKEMEAKAKRKMSSQKVLIASQVMQKTVEMKERMARMAESQNRRIDKESHEAQFQVNRLLKR